MSKNEAKKVEPKRCQNEVNIVHAINKQAQTTKNDVQQWKNDAISVVLTMQDEIPKIKNEDSEL